MHDGDHTVLCPDTEDQIWDRNFGADHVVTRIRNRDIMYYVQIHVCINMYIYIINHEYICRQQFANH